MSGQKITGIILLILGLIGAYYYIGGYLELKNQFGNVFGAADEVLDRYWPMMLASVAAIIFGLFLTFKSDEVKNNIGNVNSIPNKSSSVSTSIFDGDKSLTNDAYKIYLVKKYGIEKNEALNQVIVKDKLFNSIEEALMYASRLDEAFIESQLNNSLNKDAAIRGIAFENDEATKFGITFNNGKFIYKTFQYENFQDALNYAKSDFAKFSPQSQKTNFEHKQEINSALKGQQNKTNEEKPILFRLLIISGSLILFIGVPFYLYKSTEEKKAISALIAKSNQAFYECQNKKIKSSCATQNKLFKELTEKGYCWSRADEIWFKCSR